MSIATPQPAEDVPRQEQPVSSQPRPHRPRVGKRVASLALLMVLATALLTSVPALRPVVNTVQHIDPLWIALGVALELASCLSFVILFRLFFDRLRPRDGRAMAWTEMASGTLLPGGGAGGIAIGAWLIHLTGAPTKWIIRRSGGLFFLTSAVNSATVIVAGLLLWSGIPGPSAFTLTLLPVVLATSATLLVAVAPRIVRSHEHVPRWIKGITAGVTDAEQAVSGHLHWRLAGALGYLGFDIAVLWTTLHAVGEPISLPALVLAYNIGYLANALPIPGSIGVLDAGLAGSLLLYGASPAHVAAAVLIYHAIALWVPGVGGTLAYVRLRWRLAPSQPVSVLPDADGVPKSPISEREPHELPSPDPQAHQTRLGGRSHRRQSARTVPGARRPHSSAALPRSARRSRQSMNRGALRQRLRRQP